MDFAPYRQMLSVVETLPQGGGEFRGQKKCVRLNIGVWFWASFNKLHFFPRKMWGLQGPTGIWSPSNFLELMVECWPNGGYHRWASQNKAWGNKTTETKMLIFFGSGQVWTTLDLDWLSTN